MGSYARSGSLDNATATLTRPHAARTDVSVATTSLSSWRWAAVAAFVLFSALNFLDRQLLAAVAPMLMTEFGLTNAGYGTVLAAFSFTYMFVAPAAGMLIDRVGLTKGALFSMGTWSIVGAMTGLTTGFASLVACRMALGATEAAGIPCSSKGTAVYLPPREQGFGLAVQTIGVTVGIMAAPLLVAVIAPQYGWRATFVVCGILGLLWLPLWIVLSRKVPAHEAANVNRAALTVRQVLADRRLWAILGANVLIMVVHSMWMNWTTVYFVQVHQLTQTEANLYFAWIPPLFATLGGLFGAWLTLRSTSAGMTAAAARLRVCARFAPLLLVTALVPLMPTPLLAAVAISASFFLVMTILNNLHVLPIDLFGPGRAALTSALLASSYAMMQVFLSPAMGAIVDSFGFPVLCVAVSVLPALGVLLLRSACVVSDAGQRA